MSKAIILQARAKAFSRQPVRNYTFRVEDSGAVLVWDSVARHYTTCHALSPRAEERIRRFADRMKEAGQC